MTRAPTRETAETLALRALGEIAGDERLLARFLAQTGSAPSALAALAGDPVFLGGVLDFVLADEARLLEIADRLAVPPELPARARRLLPGWATDA